MNDVAQKTYELLMAGPEWFDMNTHRTCVLGAVARVIGADLHIDVPVTMREAAILLDVPWNALWHVCMDVGHSGPEAAKEFAERLRRICEM